MQYTNFTRDDINNGFIFKTVYPLEWVSSLVDVQIINKNGTFKKEEFRWSFNSEYWSPWLKLNANNIAKVEIKEPLLYLEFKFIPTTSESSIDSLLLNYHKKLEHEIEEETSEYSSEDNHTCCSPDNVPLIDKVLKYEVKTIDNANLLEHKDGKYYLNRANHYGQQEISSVTGLTEALERAFKTAMQCRNVPLVNDFGPGVLYSQDGSLALFKRISGDPSTIEITENEFGYIKISVKTASLPDPLYNTSLPMDLPMPNPVGGYNAGTKVSELKGKNYTALLDQLLFPAIQPTFISPTVLNSTNLDRLCEIDISVNILLTSNYSRGLIKVPNYVDRFRAGLPNTYIFHTDSSVINIQSSDLSGSTIYPYKIKRGNQIFNWETIVNYNIGDQPINSYGVNVGEPLPAGNIKSNFPNIEGVYPIYATTINTSTLTKLPLHSMIQPNTPYLEIDLVAEILDYRQKFAIATDWYNTIPIKKIQTYNTLSGQFQDSDMSLWHISDITMIDNDKQYKLYSYSGAYRSNVKIRIIF